MHPILARPGRLAAYIAIWLPLGVLLAALLALQGVLGWIDAMLVAVPLSVSYGFLCLSAWYVTGGSPVDRVGAARVGVTAVVASFLSAAVWPRVKTNRRLSRCCWTITTSRRFTRRSLLP